MHNEVPKLSKIRQILNIIMSAFFAVGGAAAVAAVIFICLHFTNALPILTFSPDVPRETVSAMMDNICSGDFKEAESYILSNPDLGIKDPEDEISAIIWDAFVDSMTYSFSCDCHTTEDGLTQRITFTCLDITSVTANLRERSQALLTQRVEEAEDVSEIYDERNEYRGDVVREMLLQAVRDALREDSKMLTTEVDVNLIYQDGQWWIQADQELLDVLFGDVLFYTA